MSKEELVEKVFPNIQTNYKNHDGLMRQSHTNLSTLLWNQMKQFIIQQNFWDATARTAIENRCANYHVVKYPPAKSLQRLAVKILTSNVIEAAILTRPFKEDALIPVTPTDMPFQFKRLQFPIRLAFAITINKAQDQSLELGGKPGNLCICTDNGTTKNTVYPQTFFTIDAPPDRGFPSPERKCSGS
ncbi:hypothetical protein J437_LFUL007337 [Ladona fulva]|uniref:ATP-dependent DNA helicase n=1 Tax=Ladona fulva TaxID=123851 RepID=A0A8K0KGQ0_LADFU|nr:hypothetical protein J437_LFUL007337 [Ladona fulva]